MRRCYRSKNFRRSSQLIIQQANEILEDYTRQGYVLTLRQLYYQFVARDLLPNLQKSYKRLGKIVNDARVAGLIDWDYLEDRTRNLQRMPHWNDPGHIIESAASGYHLDKWEGQTYRPEVWIEKDALAGIIEGPCNDNDVPWFSVRGYNSQSEMHGAAMRLRRWRDTHEQTPVIIHLGDHDPSGIHMTEDIIGRMEMFIGGVEVRRIALNMNQVEQYNPPPNFAKESDARFTGYVQEFGTESCWELDALEPRVLEDLVTDEINSLKDDTPWDLLVAKEERHKALLGQVVARWDDVIAFLGEDEEEEFIDE